MNKRLASGVWDYYIKNSENPSVSKCTLCLDSAEPIRRGKDGAPKSALSTTALWKHLEKSHYTEFKEVKAVQSKGADDKRAKVAEQEENKKKYTLVVYL